MAEPFFLPQLRKAISQGDLFHGLSFVRIEQLGREERQVVSRDCTAVLLTRDCEFDKARVDFVLMARIRDLREAPTATQGNIRRGLVRSALHVPAHGEVISESFIDLYEIVPVSKVEVTRLAESGGRVASLSDEGRQALQYRLHLYFSDTAG